MILVDRHAYHTNDTHTDTTGMNNSGMVNVQQQRQHFHDSAMADQHHGPIRVGNYAVQQPRKGFKGDSDDHVDELLSACAQHNNSVKENDVIQEVGGLQMMKNERTLVPYFGGCDHDNVHDKALEWPVQGGRHKSGKGIVNAGKKNGKKKVSGEQKKAETQFGNGTPQKQHRQERQQRDNKHGHQHAHQRQNKPQRNGKFAGPAFTVSPVPENLPMPSKLFLS